MASHAAHAGPMVLELVESEAQPSPKDDQISEETWSALRVHGRLRGIDVRRRRALLLKCILVRWRASRDLEAGAWGASCDRLCRTDDALRRSTSLQTFALRETSTDAACLIKRDLVARMSKQAKHIAGQLVLGRTTPLWQLVRRVSGKTRRSGWLVAALKDENGRVISTLEAAAVMWEREFLEAFSGMGELRDDAERGDEGRCEGGVASLAWCEAEPVVSEVEWLPLISNALATNKHGKAVVPDALPAELLEAGGTRLLPHLARLAARAMMAGVSKGWR